MSFRPQASDISENKKKGPSGDPFFLFSLPDLADLLRGTLVKAPPGVNRKIATA